MPLLIYGGSALLGIFGIGWSAKQVSTATSTITKDAITLTAIAAVGFVTYKYVLKK